MAMYLVSVLNSDISALVEFNFLIIILYYEMHIASIELQ